MPFCHQRLETAPKLRKSCTAAGFKPKVVEGFRAAPGAHRRMLSVDGREKTRWLGWGEAEADRGEAPGFHG